MSISPHGTSRARLTLRMLQHRIASGEWPLNSKIPTEKELVDELGVGRSTVREAVRTLANMGMLEPAPSRGTFVRSLTPVPEVIGEFMTGRSAAELLEVRVALEVEATRMAAERRTEEQLAALSRAHEADVVGAGQGRTPGQFHALVLRAADSALTAEMLSAVLAGLRRATDRGEVRVSADAAERRAAHDRILAAIAEGDASAAAEAARAHAVSDMELVRD